MLVIFSSTAQGDIVMFRDVAKQLLRMMGQSGKIPGGIRAENIPAALRHIKEALKIESSIKSDIDEGEDPSVSLAVRAYPLIKMLTSSAEENINVVWYEKARTPGN